MSISWFTVAAFVAGMLLMAWVKKFQVNYLTDQLDKARAERDEARTNQLRVVEAANEVVGTERQIDRAGDLPRPAGLRVLLGDAKREAPRPPSRPA